MIFLIRKLYPKNLSKLLKITVKSEMPALHIQSRTGKNEKNLPCVILLFQ